jgi:EAL domain-containing protein (putative c-di-GMP-specific phosphodiesterase class I)
MKTSPTFELRHLRYFVAGLADTNESRAIVGAVADMSRSLNMRVTAEGVETEQQLQQVRLLLLTS